MSNKIDFKFNDLDKKILNMNIAVEIIRKILFGTEIISSREFQNIVKVANRSVKE